MPLNRIRAQKAMAVVYLVVVPAMIGLIVILGAYDHYSSEGKIATLARDGSEAHRAVCVFRADLVQRARVTRAFLESHPGGFLGIDRSAIEASLANQQSTIDALSVLHCN
jgi:hypothetical protein